MCGRRVQRSLTIQHPIPGTVRYYGFMSTQHLERLLNPQSIALIGASARIGSPGLLLVQNLIDGGYRGSLYFVNPRYDSILDLPCYPSLKKIPEVPDLVILICPERLVRPTLAHSASLGVRVAVVMSAVKDTKALHRQAKKLGIRLLGPYCAGIIRPPINLNASYSATSVNKGPIALITQSASLAAAVLDWARSSGVGFSALLASGSDTGITLPDILDLLAEDPHTRAIIVYVDHIGIARDFMSAISAAARIKPVVLMKSTQGAARYCDALTQNGRVLSSDRVFQSAMNRAGVVRIRTFSNLFEAAKMLASGARTRGKNIAIISNGAAPAMLACERILTKQFSLPALSAELHERISGALKKISKGSRKEHITVEVRGDWSRVNPIVLRNSRDLAEQYRSVTELIQQSGSYDAVLVLHVPNSRNDPADIAKALTALKQSSIPLLTCWMGDVSVIPSREGFAKENIATFRTPEAAIDGFDFLYRHYRSQQQLLQLPNPASATTQADIPAVRSLVRDALSNGTRVLDPVKTRALLKLIEIDVMSSHQVTSVDDALNAANNLGYPVALKVDSPNLMFRPSLASTELNITDDEALSRAFERAQVQLQSVDPYSQNLSILVETMYSHTNHREIALQIHQDHHFGPVISIGVGGAFSPLDFEQPTQLPPLNQFLINDLLNHDVIRNYLGAFRHRAAIDLAPLSQVLRRLSELVTEIPEIYSVDINPLFVSSDGAVALNSLFVLEKHKAQKPYQHLAIHPYPWKWIQPVSLKKKLRVNVRPIRPSDALKIKSLVQNMSAESRYFRFMHAINDLTPLMMAQFTKLDYDRQIAFVAELSDETRQIIGVSRYSRAPDQAAGEFAVSVADDWQGYGVATALMNTLVDYAKEHNIKSLFGDVLRVNTAMQKLMQSLKFKASNHPTETELLVYTLNLYASD